MAEVISQFGIDWKLVLAETVNFLLVLAILYFFVFKKVALYLDQRSEKIKEGVENAENAEVLIQEAGAEKENILKSANQEASDTIAASVETAKGREAEILAVANEKGDSILATAKSKGESEKQNIIDSSKEDIAKMIVLGAEKILAQK